MRGTLQFLISVLVLFVSTNTYAQIKPNGSTQGSKTSGLPNVLYSTGDKINYVRTFDFLKAMTSETGIATEISNYNIKETTQYLDGLGRPIQTVARRALPSGADLVQYMIYDEYGRQVYRPMAFRSVNSTGQFVLDPSSRMSTFLNSEYVGEDIFYAKTEFESSPLGRPTKQMAPGNSWAGSNRGVSSDWRPNNINDQIRVWVISGATPSSSTEYAAGAIWVSITTDEDGNQTREYTDKQGQVILKRVQKGITIADQRAYWLSTYYVYDDYGNLSFVIPPKAEKVLSDNAWVWNSSDMAELIFQYSYDYRNRIISKRVPGTGLTEMVYDKLDRLVLTRDANLENLNKWLFTKYDALNRPVMTGFINSSNSRSVMQTEANAAAIQNVSTEALTTANVLEANSISLSHHVSGTVTYRSKTTIDFLVGFDSNGEYFDTEIVPALSSEYTFVQGYHDATFPSLKNYTEEILSISYFDNYDFTTKTYDSSKEVGFESSGTRNTVDPAVYTNAKGLNTGSRVKVLGTSDQWLTTVLFYDDRGRVIQTVSDNHLGGSEINTTQYDFSGKVLNTYSVHNNPKASGNDSQTLIAKRYSYQEATRLDKIEIKLNGEANYKTLVTNSYDNLGQLNSKVFGTSLETLNYDYNVRGWLNGINKDYANSGTGSHYFGMELSYDYGFSQNRFNGNIAGVKWRSKSSNSTRAYGFNYDASNRLLNADYTQGTGWLQPQNFSTTYTYDENGNIGTLQRYGNVGGTSLLIDNLSYSYLNGGKSNQLALVSDSAGDAGQSDFIDGNTIGNDYQYDDNGNMKDDLNKGITNINYNHLNLPEVVNFNGNKSITYTYDAAGVKLSKQTNDNGNISTTDYASGFIYEDNSLQHFSHEEGRVRKNETGGLVYDYYVKDHLGNTRVTLTEESVTSQYLATMEIAYREFETSDSQGLGYVNINVNNTEVNSSANTTVDQFNELTSPAPNMVLRTNGSYSHLRIGANKMIKVMTNDVVSVTVRASTGVVDDGLNPSAITASLLSQAFGGSASSTGGAEGAIFDMFNNNFSSILSAFGSQNSGATDSYLNWIMFDEDFNVVSTGTGFDQVSTSADKEVLTSGNITVPSSGYFYVYVSNEGTKTVYFDDMLLTHTKGALLQEDHYYPFGGSITALSSTAPLSKPNNYKYNGFEEQTDFDLGWYDYQARFYDPQLGRFMQVDPAADLMRRHSPYNYAFDNPIRFIDPDGMIGEDVVSGGCPEGSNCDKLLTAKAKAKQYVADAKEEIGELVNDISKSISNGWSNLKAKVKNFRMPKETEPLIEAEVEQESGIPLIAKGANGIGSKSKARDGGDEIMEVDELMPAMSNAGAGKLKGMSGDGARAVNAATNMIEEASSGNAAGNNANLNSNATSTGSSNSSNSDWIITTDTIYNIAQRNYPRNHSYLGSAPVNKGDTTGSYIFKVRMNVKTGKKFKIH